jgi:hypothetical protein
MVIDKGMSRAMLAGVAFFVLAIRLEYVKLSSSYGT